MKVRVIVRKKPGHKLAYESKGGAAFCAGAQPPTATTLLALFKLPPEDLRRYRGHHCEEHWTGVCTLTLVSVPNGDLLSDAQYRKREDWG